MYLIHLEQEQVSEDNFDATLHLMPAKGDYTSGKVPRLGLSTFHATDVGVGVGVGVGVCVEAAQKATQESTSTSAELAVFQFSSEFFFCWSERTRVQRSPKLASHLLTNSLKNTV